MKRFVSLVIGVLLALAGTVWTLQGLNLLGQSGGMNGQRLWAVIGPITVLIGLAVIGFGLRAGRSSKNPAPPR